MTPYRKLIYAIAFIILGTAQGLSAQSNDTLKVLFVGNSYIYFWNLPQTVSAMAASQRQVVVTKKSTAGGAYLREHWNGEKGLKSRALITGNDWDIVVLQNNSLSSIDHYADFMEYGKKMVQLVQDQGARPLLYATWAREYNPLMQKAITSAYHKLGAATGAEVVPVGEIWENVRNLRPDLDLYHPDGSHPSPAGTYLVACTFYSVITGRKTAPLPNRVITTDKDGEKLYLSIITKEDAGFIRQAVDEYLFPAEEHIAK